MPLGVSVGDNIRELTEANKGRDKPRPRRQVIAIALSAARKAGADVPPAPRDRKLGVRRTGSS